MFFDVYIFIACFGNNYFLEIAKNEIIITVLLLVRKMQVHLESVNVTFLREMTFNLNPR